MKTLKPIRRHDFRLPIKSEAHLKKFVELSWGVTIPDTQICENHTTPWRAFSDAYFARSSVAVWKASRGFGGKSFLLALLGLTEAATLKADVNILGGSGEQSRRVLEYGRQFWNWRGAPRQLLTGDVQRETRLSWGNRIQALMASQSSVRGPHPQRLRLDEIDEMQLSILDAAMGQPMGKDNIATQTVMSSTHQYADGTMTEVLRRAGIKGWPIFEWCYHETSKPHGWLANREIVSKRADVTEAMWNAEYDLQEPSPESRAINTEKIKALFDRSAGVYEGRSNEYIEVEPPDEKGTYATGADWAKKQDWTVIMTWRTDCSPVRLVAFERCGRMPWPAMVAKFDKQVAHFNSIAHHDGTGLGDVVNDYTGGAIPVMMVGRTRSDMLSNYIAAIERGELVAPYIKFMESEHRLASVDDVYGSGHLPDSIAAGALGYMGVGRGVLVGFA